MIETKNRTKKLAPLFIKNVDANDLINKRAENIINFVAKKLSEYSEKYDAVVTFKGSIIDFKTDVKSDNKAHAKEVEKILNDLLSRS